MTITTDNQQELFDVVNASDEVIGQATRGEVHRRGLMHRAVHIFVFNSAGGLYLQKRSQTKDRHPGCYDSSASGHQDAGEDADTCARRELREELGLEAGAGLTRLFKFPACAETGWEHVTFYTWQTDAPPPPSPSLGRMVPDVAANADPDTGYEIYFHGSTQVIGGTSAVAPLYAGLFAAFGKKLGAAAAGPALWANKSAFVDVVSGDNGTYHAAAGPDPCSGLGAPVGSVLASELARP